MRVLKRVVQLGTQRPSSGLRAPSNLTERVSRGPSSTLGGSGEHLADDSRSSRSVFKKRRSAPAHRSSRWKTQSMPIKSFYRSRSYTATVETCGAGMQSFPQSAWIVNPSSTALPPTHYVSNGPRHQTTFLRRDLVVPDTPAGAERQVWSSASDRRALQDVAWPLDLARDTLKPRPRVPARCLCKSGGV